MVLKKPDTNKLGFNVFPNARELIRKGKCPMCKGTIKEEDFKDNSSKKEYSISGMCQVCQDKTFMSASELANG